MRILHLGKYYPPYYGGIENFMAELLPAHVRRGHEVAAIVHDHSKGKLAKEEILTGVKIYRIPSYGSLLYAPISPLFGFHLKKTITAFKPDLLHIHMPNTSAFWLFFLPQAKNIPWLIHWHSDVISTKHKRSLSMAYHLYKPFEQQLIKQAKAVICTSSPYLRTSLALQNWHNKSHCIPLGISSAKNNGIHKTQLWHTNSTRLLAIGRMTYYKGYRYLIHAISAIPEIQLIIVGHGEQYQELKKLIKDKQLTERVILKGVISQAELNSLFSSCDCLCLPSIERTEAFGVVLLEAMSYRKPVIASNISGSGVSWVVKNEETGILVKPANVESLMAAIKRLIAEPLVFKQMGINGEKRFNKHFNIENVAKDLSNLYENIV